MTLPIIDIGFREPWVQLELEPAADLEAWADEQAARLVKRSTEVEEEHRRFVNVDHRSLRRELVRHARNAQGNEVQFAFVCYPSGFGTSDIYLEVSTIYPGDGTTVLDLEWFEEHFSHADAGTAQVDRLDHPAGAAVRVQRIYSPRKRTWYGGRLLLYNTSYAIDVPGTDHLVVMQATWSMAGLEDVITESTDGMFETLKVVELRPEG